MDLKPKNTFKPCSISIFAGMMLEAKEITVAMAALLFHTYVNAPDVVRSDLEEHVDTPEPPEINRERDEKKLRGLPNDQVRLWSVNEVVTKIHDTLLEFPFICE